MVAAARFATPARKAAQAANAGAQASRGIGGAVEDGVDFITRPGMTALSVAGMGAMAGPAALNFAGKPIIWAGEKTGLGFLKSTGNAFRAPARYAGMTIGEVGGRAPVLGKFIKTPVVKLTDFAGNLADKAMPASSRLSTHFTGKAESALSKAKAMVPELEASLPTLSAEMKPHAENVIASLKNGQHPALWTEETRASMKYMTENGKGFLGLSRKPLSKVAKQLQASETHAGHAGFFKAPGAAIKTLPGKLAEMKTGHVIANSAFIGIDGLTMVSEANTFAREVGQLQELYTDLTGKKISATGVLFGSVPPLVATARRNIIATSAVREAGSVVSLALNVKQLLNHHLSLTSFIVPQLVGAGAESLIGESILPVYANFKKAQSAGAELSAGDYAQFLGEVSPVLKSKGGAASPFTQAVAEQYAAEKATTAQMVQEINDGKLVKRVEAIIEQAKARVEPAAKAATQPIVGGFSQKVVKDAIAKTQNRGLNA